MSFKENKFEIVKQAVSWDMANFLLNYLTSHPPTALNAQQVSKKNIKWPKTKTILCTFDTLSVLVKCMEHS